MKNTNPIKKMGKFWWPFFILFMIATNIVNLVNYSNVSAERDLAESRVLHMESTIDKLRTKKSTCQSTLEIAKRLSSNFQMELICLKKDGMLERQNVMFGNEIVKAVVCVRK